MRRGLLVAVAFLWIVPGARAAVGTRILFVSDVAGPTQIFAATPAGAVQGQLTFAEPSSCAWPEKCGAVEPVPSPDGRHIVFRSIENVYRDGSWGSVTTLWSARADGSRTRQVGVFDVERIGPIAWAPNSRKFAFAVRTVVHIANADGTGDRVVGKDLPSGWKLAWSANGREVRYVAGTQSPDHRWMAIISIVGRTLSVQPLQASPKRWELQGVVSFDWAPNSRLLAYSTSRGVSTLDVRTGRQALLVRDAAVDIAWAPDGRSVAYLSVPSLSEGTLGPGGHPGVGTEVRTVTLKGIVRVVVPRAGPYGGAYSFAWAKVRNTRYRAAEPLDGLYARSFVEHLAADDGRVAYSTCADFDVWSPADGTLVRLARTSCWLSATPRTSDVTLAGSRALSVTAYGGNFTNWSIAETSLAPEVKSFALAGGSNVSGTPLPVVAGAGELGVYATRQYKAGDFRNLEWQIRRVGLFGCDCPLLDAFVRPDTEPIRLDVDDDRVLVTGRGWTKVLARDGRPLLRLDNIPAPLGGYGFNEGTEAALSGSSLVVRVDDEFRIYDSATGERVRTLRAAGVGVPRRSFDGAPPLQDARRGLIAYIVDNQVHVLRIGDGTDRVVGAGQRARFFDAGLVYSDGARIHVTPHDSLFER